MEQVVIVHLNLEKNNSDYQLEYKIEETKELIRSANAETVKVFIQNSKEINAKYYIGKGKVDEIRDFVNQNDVDTVLFNNELTGSQIRNLEEIINRKIIDRTSLILDIFTRRATTKEGKLQVKLAQLEYRLPRLVGFRKYLSREGAGIGTKGPGEQKLEIDRRTVQREINLIKAKLKYAQGIRDVKRNKRINSSKPIISLVGYSNAGKSTILNSIVDRYGNREKKVYSDNLLFATLDISARTIKLKNNKEVIISDTVGFISDLPTKLVESFKSTLEEIEYSDLIIIVIDSSNEGYELQIQATEEVLKELDLSDKKIMYLFNKIDKNTDFKHFIKLDNEIYISALNENHIDSLVNKIENIIFEEFEYYDALIPYDKYDELYNILGLNNKENEKYSEKGISTKLFLKKSDLEKYEEYLICLI